MIESACFRTESGPKRPQDDPSRSPSPTPVAGKGRPGGRAARRAGPVMNRGEVAGARARRKHSLRMTYRRRAGVPPPLQAHLRPEGRRAASRRVDCTNMRGWFVFDVASVPAQRRRKELEVVMHQLLDAELADRMHPIDGFAARSHAGITARRHSAERRIEAAKIGESRCRPMVHLTSVPSQPTDASVETGQWATVCCSL